jgi:hypothetical protein
MKYQLGRVDSGQVFPKIHPGRSAVLEEFRRRSADAKIRGPWRLKKLGLQFGPQMTKRDLISRANNRLKANAKNTDPDRFHIRSDSTGAVFLIQEVIEDPGATPPSGAVGFWHPKIVEAYSIAFGHPDLKGKTSFLGAFNCRRMRNSSLWSMHSDWQPSPEGVLALDIGHAVSDAGRRVADDVVRILNSRIDGLVFVTYRHNSDHANHVHGQVGGNRSGTPRCAP